MADIFRDGGAAGVPISMASRRSAKGGGVNIIIINRVLLSAVGRRDDPFGPGVEIRVVTPIKRYWRTSWRARKDTCRSAT